MEPAAATTTSFLTLAFARLWHVFNLCDRGSGIFRNDITRNRWVWAAVTVCIPIIVGSVLFRPFGSLVGTVDPGPAGWGLALGASLFPWAVGQAWISQSGKAATSS